MKCYENLTLDEERALYGVEEPTAGDHRKYGGNHGHHAGKENAGSRALTAHIARIPALGMTFLFCRANVENAVTPPETDTRGFD